MGVTDCFSKGIIYAVNIVFILGGLAILGGGIYLKVDPNLTGLASNVPNEVKDILSTLSSGAIVLIVFGAVVLGVALCGCCGVMQESQCLLGIYIFLIGAVIAAELAAGIFIYVQKDKIEEVIKTPFVGYLRNNFMSKTKPNNLTDVAYIYIMQTLQCCGWDSEADFNGNTNQPITSAKHPQVCCKLKDWETSGTAINPVDLNACNSNTGGNLYTKGCKQSFLDTLSPYLTTAIAVGASVAGLELVVFISAICFCCKVRGDQD